MKRTLFLVLVSGLVAQSLAAPKPLNNFEALMTALKRGETVKVVIDYGKTTMILDGKEQPAPKAIGGMVFSPWEYFEKGVVRNEQAYVVSSETHLIGHPRYGYVHNYVRLRDFADNTVDILARYLTTDKYEIVMDETFKGKISNGKDGHGIRFFGQ